MDMTDKEIESVTRLMFSIVRCVGIVLFVQLIYSIWEFFSHWQADGMEWHTLQHGLVGLLAAYLFICCYPAISVSFRRMAFR